MQNTLQPGGDSGGGVISGGSMSTLSREENEMVMMSSEESSNDSDLELGLGLSLGGGKAKFKPPSLRRRQRRRAEVLGITNINGSCGTKRTAESPSSPPGRSSISSQVVGWPPVRSYRMNSLANNAKSPVTEDFFSTVNMDGIPIGRKVDLNAHSCYETLARALDDMFRPSAAVGPRRSNVDEQVVIAGTRQSLRLLDSSSDFVLTYEDKEGDWMLVGDVPGISCFLFYQDVFELGEETSNHEDSRGQWTWYIYTCHDIAQSHLHA
ncbi:hypothetical protein DH2020_001248 [Rehmannia glutinosa]|uniref:Auxin-responsive protein n=1 Tax=Rehmannia glutinosa TaxID=99300 RepID=A0ABR0XZE1_REHGL